MEIWRHEGSVFKRPSSVGEHALSRGPVSLAPLSGFRMVRELNYGADTSRMRNEPRWVKPGTYCNGFQKSIDGSIGVCKWQTGQER